MLIPHHRKGPAPRRRPPANLRRPVRPRLALLIVLPFALLMGCGDRLAGTSFEDTPNSINRPEYNLGSSEADDPQGLDYAVPGQIVAKIAPGWTAEMINALWGTMTLAEIPDTPYALLYAASYDYDLLAYELVEYGACTECQRNYRISTPEAHQGSIAFYEITNTEGQMRMQPSFAVVRVGHPLINETGQGVKVAILDTGIAMTHPTLADAIAPGGWDFVDGDADPTDTFAYVDLDGDGLVDESAGHGTHVAGIVNAVAPDALLLPVRVLDTEGNGTIFGLSQGIYHAVQEGCHVINFSLGVNSWSGLLATAIRHAHGQGVFMAGSVGNENRYAGRGLPAGHNRVMAVASLDSADLKSSFSNFGGFVSISAPGESIMSTYLFDGFAEWSGTSMATPFVTGAAALTIESGVTVPRFIRHAIEMNAVPFDHTSQPYEGQMGAGRVDLAALAAFDYQ